MKWQLNPKRADFDLLAKQHGISPLTAKIMVNRGITNDAQMEHFLNGTQADMYDPMLLKDMKKAVSLLEEYLQKNKRIRIIGDYDIDGICSAYILYKGLSFVKESCDGIDIRIPHRVTDGYGLNDRLIDEAVEDGVDLIITCDNGIAAYEQIKRAKDQGICVIVTDHHEVPYEETDGGRNYILPPADAVIDPKQEDCTYPFRGICGAVVAYKVICALIQRVLCKDIRSKDGEGAQSAGEQNAVLEECLVFAAFATVGDVMDLIDENRIIVKYGLKKMKTSQNMGLRALISACDLENKEITPYHIGFVLGPCFNASGRLDDAYHVIELLSATTKEEADALAISLKQLNQERQDLTTQGEEKAYEIIEAQGLLKDRVLVVYLPDVHESLAGIIAGRLCKKYYRPTFVLTNGDDCVKGSGRSIEAYHMYDEMTKVKDIFLKYGGHKLAAGLSLPPNRVEMFRERINEVCTLRDCDLEETLMLDLQMMLGWVSDRLMDELEKLEPYGNGNEKPLFAERVYVSQVKVMGDKHNVVRMQLRNEENSTAVGVCFCDGDAFMQDYINSSEKRARIAYSPEWNEYGNCRSLQMKIRHIEWY
ncbi:MAG: single-stranded-DNA-specific exonuclease RecJ [Lachnospiraceae bacterium]|nr:single-stranded-DNA-specific exonuclease RecJ [Lachnospiraceae bacterium]